MNLCMTSGSPLPGDSEGIFNMLNTFSNHANDDGVLCKRNNLYHTISSKIIISIGIIGNFNMKISVIIFVCSKSVLGYLCNHWPMYGWISNWLLGCLNKLWDWPD